ncbi:AAA family ATPase [Breznakiellaceae bacterium SP9]
MPIGLQDFVKIREDGFLYVDKTARIYELLTGAGGVFFLSRPRRFGKSLLCSTLGALFEGRRELFAGLAIDSLGWDWKKYPVIRIDLNAGRFEDEVYCGLNWLQVFTIIDCVHKNHQNL